MFRKWIVPSMTLMLLAFLIVATVQAGPSAPDAELGTAFAYQGQLSHDGEPVSDICNLQFGLYEDELGQVQIGATHLIADIIVQNGQFSVLLDFGASAFTGDERWLGVQVRCGSETEYTDLGLQALSATPYALYALGVPWEGITDMPVGFADGVDDVSTVVSGTAVYAGEGLERIDGGDVVTLSVVPSYRLPQVCTGGQIAEWNGTAWVCGDDDAGSGGEGWSLTGNAGTDPTANFLGTTDGVSLTLAVNGTHAMRFEPTEDTPNLIGGSEYNAVTLGVVGATIDGGGSSYYPNYVSANYGTVGGGASNTASDDCATVGGGRNNTASGYVAIVSGGIVNTASDNYATVGGGFFNLAEAEYATIAGGGPSIPGEPEFYNNRVYDAYGVIGGGGGNRAGSDDGDTINASYATIGGGRDNTASDYYATVGGGADNTAGYYATVGGGWNNTADGDIAAVSGGWNNTAGGSTATVGGGVDNAADGESATIGGGEGNTANYNYATVGGGTGNTAGYYATVGGGLNNTADGDIAAVSGGWNNTADGPTATVGGGVGNAADGESSTIGGGNGNVASGYVASVGGGIGNTADGNRVTISGGWDNTASGNAATVGGGYYNLAEADFATIAGGGPWDLGQPEIYNNRVYDDYGVIGGGGGNRAGSDDGDTTNAPYATIGGGRVNTVSGTWGTVGGGYANTASGTSATVGGGTNSTVSGDVATIGGGFGNIASGYAATIPGGAGNTASGNHSFAAGLQAQANHDGAIVLADSNNFDFASMAANTFNVRATGGVYFMLGINGSGAPTWNCLVGEGSSWSCSSDRNLKENFDLVAGGEVLQRLAEVPIYTWNAKGQDPALQHMGPMAQDFYAAFELGGDDTHIATIDLDGVALAAIQGLYAQNQALEAENADLHRQIDDLDARLSALEDQMADGSTGAPLQANLLPGVGLFMIGGVGLWLIRRKQLELFVREGGK